jgi:hypothetical protein
MKIANAEDYIPTGEYNPHNVRPWLIGNEYGVLAIAYAEHEQDAMDVAADNDTLGGLALDEDYVQELYADGEDIAEEAIIRLGNAGEPFDAIHAWIKELPNRAPDELGAMCGADLWRVAR